MYNYKLIIEYDGRKFNGWQKQKLTGNTIQEHIESSAEKILGRKIKLIGAGRTDSGVSAYNQVANFNLNEKLNLNKFGYSLNSILDASVTVKKISIVKPEFHSRYSAKKREYIYKVTTRKKSIEGDYFYRIGFKPDFKVIDRFFAYLKKQRNFKSLCKNKEDKHNFNCLLYVLKYKIIKSKDEIIFTITASRFLHSMVRAVIGCALEAGRGKLNLEFIKDKIQKGEKINVKYVPANALFLKKIYY